MRKAPKLEMVFVKVERDNTYYTLAQRLDSHPTGVVVVIVIFPWEVQEWRGQNLRLSLWLVLGELFFLGLLKFSMMLINSLPPLLSKTGWLYHISVQLFSHPDPPVCQL